MNLKKIVLTVAAAVVVLTAGAQEKSFEERFPVVPGRWSVEKINAWYDKLPWLVGANYYPATAINQIEMWQASTWDPERIDLELGWAEELGFNTLRVYLHDLVWEDDEKGLYKRMDQFLDICKKHGIRPSFVFFDDCHFPDPKLGVQPLPVREFHNSGWLNCPARDVATRYAKGQATEAEKARLKGYVQRTIKRFKNDKRVLYWELYNEPGRGDGTNGDMKREDGSSNHIGDLSMQLVYDSWVWAREINPSQPIVSNTGGSVGEGNKRINRENTDFLSIHTYDNPKRMEDIILNLKRDQKRPIVITEWLARTVGCTVQGCLPVMKKYKVGAIQWGFVLGKTQTNFAWGGRLKPDGTKRNLDEERAAGNVLRPGDPIPEPKVWFHDLLRTDGTPYDPEEVEVYKELTGKK